MPYPQLVFPAGRRRVTRALRVIRAAWRDTMALLREFHRPLIVFLAASVGGGALYGLLHNQVAGLQPPIPAINLPYYMVALMILESPSDPPVQPYLIAFWYAMPLIALYVVGRGVTDFVRLFFDRAGRRAAWEEAVASTYRHHVIVLGVGHVGLRVVRTLAGMGFDVVGIEQHVKPDVEAELDRLGVPLIEADGRLPATLEKAGLRDADALVVCTASDHSNLEIIMRARDLNPDIRIVVRMWDSQFAQQLHRFMGVQAVLSASDLAAPAFAGAAVGVEITQTLKVRGVEYSMIRLTVAPGSFLAGETIDRLQEDNDTDIVLHEHGDSATVHPDGQVIVRAGDVLVLFARHSQIIDIAARNRPAR